MSEKIKVALLGLGNVGQQFAEAFLEIIQEKGKPVEIVAVAHRHLDSPVALGFSQSGVPVYEDPLEVASLGEKVDIIFDVTGDESLRQSLRQAMADSNNRHTVIVPESVAKLMYLFFEEGNQLIGGEVGGGY